MCVWGAVTGSLLPLSCSSRFGGSEAVCVCGWGGVLKVFVVSGLSHAGAGPRKLSLVGNAGQLGTSIHSNFYRHVRTWEPVSSIASFFFFFKAAPSFRGDITCVSLCICTAYKGSHIHPQILSGCPLCLPHSMPSHTHSRWMPDPSP